MLSVFIHLFFFSGFCTLRALHSFPTRRSSDLLLAVVVMLPGMITGSSTAAVLTTGALVAPVLIRLGLDRDRAGAFVAMAAIYGMLAPPVNIPAMLIGGGVDLPYVGLEPPLLLATVPLALVTAWYLGLPALGRTGWPAGRRMQPSLIITFRGRTAWCSPGSSGNSTPTCPS